MLRSGELLYTSLASLLLWFTLFGFVEWSVRIAIFRKDQSKFFRILPIPIRKIFFSNVALQPSLIIRYVASIYSVIVSFIGGYYLFLGCKQWQILQSIPVGYNIFGIIMYFGKNDLYFNESPLVPIYCSLFLCLSLFISSVHPKEVACVYLTELGTPFLHIIYTMIRSKMTEEYSPIFRKAKEITFISFITFRIVFSSLLWFIAIYELKIVFLVVLTVMCYINIEEYIELRRKIKESLVK